MFDMYSKAKTEEGRDNFAKMKEGVCVSVGVGGERETRRRLHFSFSVFAPRIFCPSSSALLHTLISPSSTTNYTFPNYNSQFLFTFPSFSKI